MRTLQRLFAYGSVSVLWGVIIWLSAVSGVVAIVAFGIATLGGIFIGAVNDGRMSRNVGFPSWAILVALLLTLVLPTGAILLLRDGTTSQSINGASISKTSTPLASRENVTVSRKRLAQNAQVVAEQSFDAGHEAGKQEGVKVGVEEGKKQAYDPPKTFSRKESEIKPAQIGTNDWVIYFQKPGPTMIETEFDLPLGQAYYISTPRLIPNFQIGRLARNDLVLMDVPASAFTEDKPACYKMCANVPGAKMVFYTLNVPDGRYEIRISKSPVLLRPDEYGPNIKSDRNKTHWAGQ